jgi:hypothetical protein
VLSMFVDEKSGVYNFLEDRIGFQSFNFNIKLLYSLLTILNKNLNWPDVNVRGVRLKLPVLQATQQAVM